MANTVTTLSYANTFGDWVVITDSLVTEVNTIGFGNYIKPTGLLTLAAPGIALQIANNALMQGNVVIQGAGQALQVSHDAIISGNLTVLGNTTFSGYEIDLNDITSNTFHTNVATFNVSITGTNAILNVSNNVVIASNLTTNTVYSNVITVNTSITGTNAILNVANNLVVSGNLSIRGNGVVVTAGVTANTVSANALYGQANTQIAQQISDAANSTSGSALAYAIALG
jgi:hypothetical protein